MIVCESIHLLTRTGKYDQECRLVTSPVKVYSEPCSASPTVVTSDGSQVILLTDTHVNYMPGYGHLHSTCYLTAGDMQCWIFVSAPVGGLTMQGWIASGMQDDPRLPCGMPGSNINSYVSICELRLC